MHPSHSFLPPLHPSADDVEAQATKYFPFKTPSHHDTQSSTHMTENHARISPAQVESIAGFWGGTIATLAVHPLDVIKTRLHIARNQPSITTNPTGSIAILRSLLRNPQPIQSLYRGLTPNIVGNSTSWALFFGFKSLAEKQLLAYHDSTSGRPDGAKYELRSRDYLISSGISGTFVTLSTNPIWVVKTRMLSSDKGAEGAYKNMWHGAQQVFRNEGLRGFYRGAGISLMGNAHGAVQFAVYEPMKKAWRKYNNQGHIQVKAAGQREEKLGNTALLFMSGFAKVFAGTATYPYQVVRSRLQTYHSEERFGRGIRGVAQRIWSEDGWKGFYRGLGPNIVKVLPSTWVTFLVYENVKYYFTVWSEEGGERGF